MVQNSEFLTSPKSCEITTIEELFFRLSPELLLAFILNRYNSADIACRKVVYKQEWVSTSETAASTPFEIEQQKMAFLQKLVEVVRKSSAKSSTGQTDNGQDLQRSARIAPNSSN